jgi:hypothetical protein
MTTGTILLVVLIILLIGAPSYLAVQQRLGLWTDGRCWLTGGSPHHPTGTRSYLEASAFTPIRTRESARREQPPDRTRRPRHGAAPTAAYIPRPEARR